jgi:hypothetical protein
LIFFGAKHSASPNGIQDKPKKKKKKAKVLVIRRRHTISFFFLENCWSSSQNSSAFILREAEPREFGGWPPRKTVKKQPLTDTSKKEAKQLFVLRSRWLVWVYNPPRSGATGVWGLAPKEGCK